MPANGVTGSPGLPSPAREGGPVARNNFGFEKRQRELSKERKKEEKRQRKQDRQNVDQPEDAQEPGNDAAAVDDGPGAT